MRPVTPTKQLTASNATVAAAVQALGAAGKLALVGGGIVTLDTQRRVIITSTGNDAARTATIIGAGDGGQPIKDSFLLTNAGVAVSNLDFLTINSIALDGAAAANVSAGTNTTGSTPWQLVDNFVTPQEIAFWMKLLSGAATANLEYTYDPVVISPVGVGSAIAYGAASLNPVAIKHAQLQNVVANTEGAIDFAINAWRLTIIAGTGQFSCSARQSGLSGG